jgi:Flp pilus assembly protein TadG
MKREIGSFADRLRRDESGSVIILVAMGIVAFLGLGALAIDVSRIVYAQRALQDTTDLAAQAGATEIYSGSGNSATATVTSYYNAKANSYNFQRGLNVTSVSATLVAVNGNSSGGCPYTTAQLAQYPACVASGANSGCTAVGSDPDSGCNAIVVTQQAKVSLMLGGIFGMESVTLTAKSLAVGKGGALPPLNIMIVLDNTASMSQCPTGQTCCPPNNSKIDCALQGVQILLSELWTTDDQVGLFVFPPVKTSTAGNDSNCAGSAITPEPYCSTGGACSTSTPAATYQIVTPTNNYKSSNAATSLTLPSSTGSALVDATCQSGMTVTYNGNTISSCGTCQGIDVKGGEGTYLAGAINAAQQALVASSDTGVCASLACQNVIIVLSDGGAGNGTTLGQLTAKAASAGATTLSFTGSVPSDVIIGTNVAIGDSCGSPIPCGTSVVSVSGSTVTLSNSITGSGVTSGTTINFGEQNQCWESVTAAQNAAKAGTWVYAIAYGSYTEYPNSNSCSDTETPGISSCTTMQDIASSPTAIPDPTKFYSDPLGVSPPCTSSANPSATSVPSIFSNIGYNLQYTTLLACGTAAAGGYC